MATIVEPIHFNEAYLTSPSDDLRVFLGGEQDAVVYIQRNGLVSVWDNNLRSWREIANVYVVLEELDRERLDREELERWVAARKEA